MKLFHYNMWLKKLKYILCFMILIVIYFIFGIGDHIQEKSYEKFDYPLSIDIRPIVEQMLIGQKPNIEPINLYPYKYLKNPYKCNNKTYLFILVKSAMNNFDRRNAIRKTWGLQNKSIKIAFFLGMGNSSIQPTIEKESVKNKDIVQAEFIDTYFNNTIKTMISFKWAFNNCPNSQYYLFSDDDMYISIRNLLKYLNKYSESGKEITEPLFAGYVFNSAPHRHISSKWRVNLNEYPFDKWPPYVTAGAYIVSNRSLKVIYLGSLYVKHFRFDDIYLGIVARKVGIKPKHCNEFYFYKKSYRLRNYKDVIACHGYGKDGELIRVWNEQRSMGYA